MAEPKDLELYHVLLFFRHGDRSPITAKIGEKLRMDKEEEQYWLSSLPTEKTLAQCNAIAQTVWKEKDQPAPKPRMGGVHPRGQLTEKGAQGMRQKGALLRRKYDAFLTKAKKIDPTDVYIRSTNVIRTIQSCQNLLLGLFPEFLREGNGTEPSLLIRVCDPITLAPSHKKLSYKNHVEELRAKTDSHPFNIAELEAHVREVADVHPDEYLHWTAVREVLVCRNEHGLKFPDGITDHHYQQVMDYNAWEWHSVYSDKNACRNGFGEGVQEVFELMHLVTKQERDHRITLLSGHDSSLVALLQAFKLDIGNIIPHYSTVLSFEIYKDSSDSFFLKAIFEDKELVFPHNNDSTLCTFEHFQEIVNDFWNDALPSNSAASNNVGSNTTASSTSSL